MSKLTDPAKEAKTKDEAKDLRKAAWKRPTKQTDREKAKEERLQDWRTANGISDTNKDTR